MIKLASNIILFCALAQTKTTKGGNCMKTTQKNLFAKILSRGLKSLILVIGVFASIFLAGCGKEGSSLGYGFDAYGKYRINDIKVLYYEKTTTGETNEFTGSFLVPMEFYYTKSYEEQYDDYFTLLANDQLDYENEKQSFIRDLDQSGMHAIRADGKSFSELNVRYPDYNVLLDGKIYQIHVAVNESALETEWQGGSTYSNRNYIKANGNLSDIFKFSYREGTSGTWKDADGFISAVYMKINATGDKLDVISGASGNQAQSYDKVFYMSFHPELAQGSTTRRIRIKAVPNELPTIDVATNETYKNYSLNYVGNNAPNRGDSLYSQVITFSAYKLAFRANSVNSASIDYGQVEYDSSKYHFYNSTASYSLTQGKDYITQLDGMFPAGRVVEVKRTFDESANGNDYAFQSWTANKLPVNTLMIENTLPSGADVEDYMFEDHSEDNPITCLFGTTVDDKRFFARTYFSTNTTPTTFDRKSTTNVFEDFNTDTRVGTLYVTSCKDLNSTTFYANFLKIDNFTLSGTLFDADRILDGNDAKLYGVRYFVYNKDGELQEPIAGEEVPKNEFKITGLKFGDYVVFKKTEQVTYENNGVPEIVEVNYNFYGNETSNLIESNGKEVVVLKNYVTNDDKLSAVVVTDNAQAGRKYYLNLSESNMFAGKYSVDDGKVFDKNGNVMANFDVEYVYQVYDITNTAILATKYDKDTSVVVNVNIVDPTTNNLVDPTEYGVSYEVISSVTSFVDTLGCVKTTVYVSVVVPSNISLQSYNVITDNSVASSFYKNSNSHNNTILRTSVIEDETILTKYYFAKTSIPTIANITTDVNDKYLIYAHDGINELFVYLYTNTIDSKAYRIYQSASSSNMISRYESEYELVELELISNSENINDISYVTQGSESATDGSMYGYLIYNGYMYFYAGDVFSAKISAEFDQNIPAINNNYDNVSYSDSLVYDKDYSYTQSKNKNTYKTLQTSLPTGLTVQTSGDYFKLVSTKFTESLSIENNTQAGKTYTLKEFTTSPMILMKQQSGDKTYYTFYYNNTEYYYYNNKIYETFKVIENIFVDEVTNNLGCERINFDVLKGKVTFTRKRLEYLNKFYYYKVEQINSTTQKATLHTDFYCLSEPVDFVTEYGYKSFNIDPTTEVITLERYRFGNYYVRLDSNVGSMNIYQNFECTNLWDYTGFGEDTIDVDFANNKISFSNSFSTYISFTPNASTYYIKDHNFKLYNSDGSELKEINYSNVTINTANHTLSLKLGTDFETRVSPSGVISLTDTNTLSSANELTINDGKNARNMSIKYFGASNTSLEAECYPTDMDLSGFYVDEQYFYVSDTDVDENNNQVYSLYAKTQKVVDGKQKTVNARLADRMIRNQTVDATGKDTGTITSTSGVKLFYYSSYEYVESPRYDASGNLLESTTGGYFYRIYNLCYFFMLNDSFIDKEVVLIKYFQDTGSSINLLKTYFGTYISSASSESEYFRHDGIDYQYDIENTPLVAGTIIHVKNSLGAASDKFFMCPSAGTLVVVEEKSISNASFSNEQPTYTVEKNPEGSDSRFKLTLGPSTVPNIENFYDKFALVHSGADTSAIVINLYKSTTVAGAGGSSTTVKVPAVYDSKDSNCYAYYDIKPYVSMDEGPSYVTEYFVTTPFAKISHNIDSTGNKISSIEQFYDISNFNELYLAGKIKLGVEINPTDDPHFFKVMGSKIMNSYYYYVEKLGDSKTIYVTQEAVASSGQINYPTVKYYDKAGNLYSGEIYVKESVVFETHIQEKVSNVTINELSGWVQNIDDRYIVSVTNEGSSWYSVVLPGTTTKYYFTTKIAGTSIAERNKYELYTAMSADAANATGHSVVGIDANTVVFNYLSFNVGNNNGSLFTETGEEYVLMAAGTNDNNGENDASRYSMAANISTTTSPIDSPTFKIDNTKHYLQTNMYASGKNKFIHTTEYNDAEHMENVTILLSYSLYKCYSSAVSSGIDPTPVNIYVGNDGFAYVNSYTDTDEDGKPVYVLKKLLDNSGQPITFAKLYEDWRYNSAGADIKGTTMSTQYLYGSYMDTTKIVKGTDGKYYLVKIDSNGNETYYFYDESSAQFEMEEPAPTGTTNISSKQRAGYMFYYGGYYYYIDNTNTYLEDPLNSSSKNLNVFKVSTTPNPTTYSNKYLKLSELTNGGIDKGTLTFNTQTNQVFNYDGTLFATINPTTNTIIIAGDTKTYSVVKTAYDVFTDGIYFFDTNSVLYSACSYNSSTSKFEFSNVNIIQEFSYFFYKSDEMVELRPAAQYFVFTNYKIMKLIVTATGETLTHLATKEVNLDVYAKNMFTNQLVGKNNIVSAKRVTYYSDPNFTDESQLSTSVEYEIVDIGNSSNYASPDPTNPADNVTIMGKFTASDTSGAIVTYPSFSFMIPRTDRSAATDLNAFYPIDPTNKTNATEGFPGVTFIDGAPYVNPLFSFDVYHKQGSLAKIDLNLQINHGYYIELGASMFEQENSDIVTDFTTVTFKSTLANLLANDYLDNMYLVVDKVTYKSMSSYRKIDAVKSTDSKIHVNYNIYYTTYKDDPSSYKNIFMTISEYLELSNEEQLTYFGLINDGINYYQLYSSVAKVTDCAVNEDENDVYIYFEDTTRTDENGNLIYVDNIFFISSGEFTKMSTNNVSIWKSSTASLIDIPYYDIHTYTQDELTGIIYVSSDLDENNPNSVCNGLEGLETGDLSSPTAEINYENVVIAGLTNAYKVKTEILTNGSLSINRNELNGYWIEKAISVLNTSETSEVYVNCGDESVVFLACPLISLNGEIYYRLKEWRVYQRENAEYVYFDKEQTEALGNDRYSAICRFSTGKAGSYVILPVYEKVYSISMATQVENGSINIGGSINVSSDKVSVDINKNNISDDLFVIDYVNTNSEKLYYDSINTETFLYFTGSFNSGLPVFMPLEVNSDINNKAKTSYMLVKGTKIGSYQNYYIAKFESGNLVSTTNVKKITSMIPGKPGLISVENNSGYYKFNYNLENNDTAYKSRTVFYDAMVFRQVSFNGEDAYVLADSGNANYYPITEVMSYVMTAVKPNESVNKSSETKVVLANDEFFVVTNDIYSIFARMATIPNYTSTLKIDDVVNTNNKIARLVRKQFYIARRSTTDIYKSGYYSNPKNNLSSGELYTDENGHVYSTLQYKDAYYDRDSQIALTAVANSGYRLEGWYLAEYDKNYGWVVSDKKINEQFQTFYSNEIIKTQFDLTANTTTFTLTEKGYFPTSVNGSTKFNRTYTMHNDTRSLSSLKVLFSSDMTAVPSSIISNYCGIYVNLGNSRQDPYFVQVYAKNGDHTNLYYDAEFTRPFYASDVTATSTDSVQMLWNHSYIGYMNHYEAVNASFFYNEGVVNTEFTQLTGTSYTPTSTTYTLNGLPVYAVFEYNNQSLTYDIKYYKNVDYGNYIVEGDNLYIKNLHSNIRIVAKFVEIYQTLIFNELEDESGISVQALYYFNEDDTKTVVRTSSNNTNLTSADISLSNTSNNRNYLGGNSEGDDFAFQINKNEADPITLFSPTLEDPSKSYLEQYYTEQSVKNFSALAKYNKLDGTQVNGSFDKNAYAMYASENKSLSLKNYYFDSNTTIYLVVRVQTKFQLSIHSLGLNAEYVLNFLVEPNLAEIKEAKDSNIEYVFYLLKVTFDRNMEQTEGVTTGIGNENPEFVLHPEKSKNVVSDILSGNNIEYYDSLFDSYISVDYADSQRTYQNDLNIAKDNYLIFDMKNDESYRVKIAFNNLSGQVNTRSFSFSKSMAENLFYQMVSNTYESKSES